MRRLLYVPVVVIVLAFASPVGALATNITVKATLSSMHETPTPSHRVPAATGVLTGTLTQTKAGYNFEWRLTYAKTSGSATFTNVQEGTTTKHGTVILFLCGPCRTGAHGKVFASPGEVSLLLGGKLFVNLTTKQNPTGEIRGQLTKSG